jgi:hypothetical protein
MLKIANIQLYFFITLIDSHDELLALKIINKVIIRYLEK